MRNRGDETPGGEASATAVGIAGGPGKFARGYAWLVIRLRYVIVLAWILGSVAAVTQLPGLEDQGSASAEGLVASNSRAIATQTRSYRRFGTTALAETAIVQRDPRGLAPDARRRIVDNANLIREQRDPALKDIRADLPILNAKGAPAVRSEHDTTAIHYLFFDPSLFIGQQAFLAHLYAKNHMSSPGDALVGVTGVIPARVEQENDINDALPLVTAGTVVLIALALFLTLRSVLAPILTLVCAGLAYAVAGRVVVWVGQRFDISVPRELEPLVVVLLLGIVTDYCIFYLTDTRSRLLDGASPRIAAERATAKVGPIVLTAGLIVSAGTATLTVGTMGFFRALGPGMALTALVGVVAALTLVPALMSILGRRLFWPGIGRLDQEERVRWRTHRDSSRYGVVRRTIARLTSTRGTAVVVAIVCVAGLGYGGYQLAHARLGINLIEGLPDGSEARRAQAAAAHGFTPGIIAPTEILLERGGIGAQGPQLVALETALAREPGVAGVLGPRESLEAGRLAGANPALSRVVQDATISHDRGAARFLVVLQDDPFESRAIDVIHRLEHNLPGLLQRTGLEGAQVGIGGQTALSAETVDEAKSNLLRLSVAALLVNLLFLVVFLRALIAPLYLLGASVLALAASLGLTAWFFQDGLGYGQIAYYIPFAAAVLLLSLGSDYNIFIVGRIWDEARKRPVEEAVEKAAPEAAGPITIAGLVLAGSFALLALIPLVPFRAFAFAMSAGVLIDSFVVRSLLAPSLITAFGRVGAPEPGVMLRGPAARTGAVSAEAATAADVAARVAAGSETSPPR